MDLPSGASGQGIQPETAGSQGRSPHIQSSSWCWSTLCSLSYLIFTVALLSKDSDYPHFTDEETYSSLGGSDTAWLLMLWDAWRMLLDIRVPSRLVGQTASITRQLPLLLLWLEHPHHPPPPPRLHPLFFSP